MTVAAPATTSAPALEFTVDGAAVAEAALPAIALDVRARRTAGRPLRSLVLNVQLRIAAPRRAYDGATRERLRALFGAPDQWHSSLRSLLWLQTTVTLPPFDAEARVVIQAPCTYELDFAVAKYLHGVRDGTIPLELLFSGTAFYAADGGRLATAQLPWDLEATCELPATLWHDAMDRFYGDRRWLRLAPDSFDALAAYRTRHALSSWEDAIGALLAEAGRR